MQCTNSDFMLNLAISGLEFLSSSEKLTVRRHVENLENLLSLSLTDIAYLVKRVITTSLWRADELLKKINRQLHIMESYDIHSCTLEDSDYPELLKNIYDPPFMLVWRGNKACLYKKTVAVVGTRRPSFAGIQAARDLAAKLAGKNYTVVSGLALGIDAAAHKGAVSAGKASTAAVLASGVDVISPETNKKLAAAILQKDGCIISEYPPETVPVKWRFPARNRIISGLSAATVVIEAPVKSGSLITADFALEQGRDLFFHQLALQRDYDGEERQPAGYVRDGATVINGAEELIAQLDTNTITSDKRIYINKQPVLWNKTEERS